jgi:hypothetical protein
MKRNMAELRDVHTLMLTDPLMWRKSVVLDQIKTYSEGTLDLEPKRITALV